MLGDIENREESEAFQKRVQTILENMKNIVTVQCQRNSAGWDRLGTSNFPFYYNNIGFESPVIETIWAFRDFTYVPIAITDNGNWASLNIVFIGDDYGTDGQDVSVSWMDVVTLSFDIIDPGETSGLVWRDDGAWACYDDGETTIVDLNSGSGLDVPLPVELSSFKAIASMGDIILLWTTESELSNEGFEVYRSIEEEGTYTMLDTYKSKDGLVGHGNSSTKHGYSYIDNTILQSQTYWYKIADMDVNGVKTYHGPISIDFTSDKQFTKNNTIPTEFNLYQNYPNPFNPHTTIKFALPEQAHTNISVFNSNGQVIQTLIDEVVSEGYHQIKIKSTNLSSGIYYYQIQTDKFYDIKKMVLLK